MGSSLSPSPSAGIPRRADGNPDGHRTMVFTLASMFLGGSTVALASMVLPHAREVDDAGIYATLSAGYLLGAAVLMWGRRTPLWGLQVLLALGSLIVTVAYYFNHALAKDNEMFYVWGILYASYFFSRRQAMAQLGFVAAAYAAVLTAQAPGPASITNWMVTVGTLAIAGLIVSVLRERVKLLLGRLGHAARTDSLTGLRNRLGFEEGLQIELERSRRSGKPLSLVWMDLDLFKEVNDRFGHQTGDDALRRVGALVSAATRGIDVAARTGGEEIAILLPATDADAAVALAERVRVSVREAFAGEPFDLTISAGVATTRAALDGSRLVRAADEALYQAKRLGRDRVECAAVEAAAAAPPVRVA